MRPVAPMPVLLFLLLLSACSARAEDSAQPATSAAAKAPSGPASPKNPQDSLALPQKPSFLVPVTQGSHSEDLPPFTPTEGVYSIHALCTGKGTVSIHYGSHDEDPSEVKCGTPVTVGRVHTDRGKPQNLSMRVDGSDIHWAVAVVAGTQAR
ncbi:hypothetical protein FNH09_20810 [Streptomyces adustus]|uniref:Lipoprotein n=1 Tax=Streptomyces adustus TaxID=1609272 RepID=A0A5N8VEC9_9ACTN|nr:hypothetical protein [Streptomyces adustus]MPY33600.1 hypothetical protein [Streptomyces adustus]